MKTQQVKKAGIAAAVLILLFSIGLRINAPRADLPSHLTFSGSILTDEGNQCHNSRSKALYGEWFPDDWKITNYNPVLPWIKYAVFKVFGVGLLQLRLVNYIFASLSLLFFFLTLKSYFGQHLRFALLGTLLLGTNFLYLMYNKIGTFETSIIFWVILTLYFLEKYRCNNRVLFLVLAGASTFMTLIFKSIMAYILPLPFAAYILVQLVKPGEEKISLKKGVLDFLFILLGMMALFLPWYIFHYLPNREWIISSPGQFMGNLIFPKSVKMAVDNILNFSYPWQKQFYKIPIIWLGALLYIPFFYRRLLTKKTDLTEIGYVLFFFAHTAMFSVMTYRPTRYFIPVIPAMVWMAVMLFQRLTAPSAEPVPLGPVKKSLLFVIDTLWLGLTAYFCLFTLYANYVGPIRRPGLSLYYIMVSAVLVAAAYGLKKRYRRRAATLPDLKPLLITLVAIMVVISLFIDMKYYARWYRDRTYTVLDINRELGEKLDNAYIAGMTAPEAVLENRHKALWLYPNFVNWNEYTFEKYPLTHALLGADISLEILHYFKQWPERMNRAKLLRVYHIKDYFLHLYSFENPYIAGAQMAADGQSCRLMMVNPSRQPVSVRIGEIDFYEQKPGEGDQEPGFRVIPGTELLSLPPGGQEMVIPLEKSPDREIASLLFFLDYTQPFSGTPLRYEGEMFSARTGSNRKIPSASDGFVRYFNRETEAPGFLAYGPAVPYGTGFLRVDFNVKFANLNTSIRPLCQVEIYGNDDKGPLAQRTIRPSDIKKNRDNLYRLSTLLPVTKTLEFRIKTENWADVLFDYLDITYYQGYFIDLKKDPHTATDDHK
jgi:hypothetical protein